MLVWLTYATVLALAIIGFVSVIRLLLQEIRKLIVEWEKTALRYKKTQQNIKSSKETNNSPLGKNQTKNQKSTSQKIIKRN